MNIFQAKGSFASDVIKMVSAPLLLQLISIFATPLITRIYSPEDFGTFALYISILGPVGVLICGGYEPAIMLPKTDREASTVFQVTILFTFVFSVLSIFIMFAATFIYYSFFEENKILSMYIWLLIISIPLSGFSQSARYWNLRKRYFGLIASSNISSNILEKSIVIGFGLSGFATGLTLIWANLASGILKTFISTWRIIFKERSLIFANINLSVIIDCIRRYNKFPKYVLSTNLLTRFSESLPIFFLSYYFSQTIIGYYALGLRMLTIPMSLINSSIGEVFFQRESQNKGNNSELLESLFKRLVLLGMFPFFLISIVGADIFSIAFGNEWSQAGLYAQFLGPFIFIRFITNPADFLMLIYEKQEMVLFLNILNISLSVIAIIIGGLFNNIILTLFFLSFFNSILYLIYGVWLMNLAGLALKRIYSILARNFFITLPFLLVLAINKWYINAGQVLIFSIVIVEIIIYYFIVLRKDPFIKSKLSQINIFNDCCLPKK